ncbi:hypothetical protein LCGC14_3121330 [marine sediment metagenome]|uniref:Uncharacterized protein n=1 Tax=marine sediment metagenome TaxID=412755 RepID=A0A0F8YS05_9ZZZZ
MSAIDSYSVCCPIVAEVERLCLEIRRLYREHVQRVKCHATLTLLDTFSDDEIREHRRMIDETWFTEACEVTQCELEAWSD